MFDARPALADIDNRKSNFRHGGTLYKSLAAAAEIRELDNSKASGIVDKLKSSLSMERLREFREARLSKLRPWIGEFFSREQFSIPDGVGSVQNRLSTNIRYFQSNYLVIFGIFFAYCL